LIRGIAPPDRSLAMNLPEMTVREHHDRAFALCLVRAMGRDAALRHAGTHGWHGVAEQVARLRAR
jgi:hypothetical protein